MKSVSVLDSRTQGHGFLLVTSNSPRSGGKLIKKTNPMQMFRMKRTLPGYTSQYMGNFGDAYYYNKASVVVNSRCPAAYAQAYARFKSKAWGDNQVQTAVSLAESREALSMVTDTILHLVKGMRMVRRGKFRDAARHFGIVKPPGVTRSKQFLDNWMAYRYGWAPTVQDLYDHADAMANPPQPSFIRAVGRGDWSNRQVSGTSWSEGKARVVIKAKVSVSNPSLARLNQFGALNPAEWIWELIPLSFVADWFFRVGDYLSNFSSFVGLSFSECSITYWYKSINRLWNAEKYRFEIESKERVVTSVLPNPPFMYGSGLNPKRAMDGLALIQGWLRGR